MRKLLVLFVASGLVLIGSSKADASTIQLQGLLGTGVTATVSNFSLVGDVFSFDLSNTSASGLITNVGIFLGDVVEATGFSTTAPFSYTLIHDGAPPPPPLDVLLPANDFFLIKSPTTGILPGSTFSFAFTGLTLDDGSPLSGVTADFLAGGVGARFVQNSINTDIAAAVPEPTSLLLIGTGLAIAGRRIRRRSVS